MKNYSLNHLAKVVCLFVLLAAATQCAVAQHRSFDWQGVEREYMLYTPDSRSGALPVLFFLHGLGDNIDRLASMADYSLLASSYGWNIILPQALTVQNTTMWNVGFGGNADDAGFFLALLDSLIDIGQVNPDSVFFTGFSLGGFMTHKMAIEHGDRITACAPVSGLITYSLADEVPVAPVRMMHIHGTADDVVGWSGGSAYFGNIGISVDSVVSFWTGWNGCDPTPDIDSLPDKVADGLRFVRHAYTGGDADFQLIEVMGGRHEWYYGTSHDIDYLDFIHKFFLNEATTLGFAPQPALHEEPQLRLWPNPSGQTLNVCSASAAEARMFDSKGNEVMHSRLQPGVNTMSLCSLPSGTYFLSDGSGKVQRLVVAR